ncbi:hypothetical protein K488DRAFT_55321 [Vararia minispora EC-137]|uniref:Uncharacterized protein n=1 Tax=Vararia minispora EC-137 TaxID=1314806 RepID=A0ACB8QE25_9AGAM|nr:hypothetical protein K488DRAFT_55321 [Vararia minispora EC-137]
MAPTDSVSIFAEGTFEEQIVEFAEYISRSLPEQDRAAYIEAAQQRVASQESQPPLSGDTDRKQEVLTWVLSEMKGLGEGTDREIEGFFNLLFAHLLTLWPISSDNTKQHVSALLNTVTSSSGDNTTKYRILSNLFNALPRSSRLRLTVYNCLLSLANSQDDLGVLQLSHGDVEKWLSEWDVSASEKSEFLQLLISAHANADQPVDAYLYKLAYVRSLDSKSAEARTAALDAIATALTNPTIFDFDPLFKLDAVVAAKDDPLFSLLRIFLSGGLPELEAWHGSNSGALEKHNLSYDQLERKMRLLALAALAFQNVGADIPYATIASTIRVDQSAVESWAIDIIRAGLLVGKLSQSSQTLRVLRASARVFGRPQWTLLEQRLLTARMSLSHVLEVIASARRRNEHVVSALQTQAAAESEKVAAVQGEVAA